MSLRALFYASDISPQSGASHALLLTMTRLRSAGVEVSAVMPDTVVSREFMSSFPGEIRHLKMQRMRGGAGPVGFAKGLASAGWTIATVTRLLRSKNVDVLHLNEITDVLAGVAAVLAGVPCVCHVRADGIPNPHRRILLMLLKLLAGCVVVPSASTRKWIEEESRSVGARTSIVYDCAFDPTRYDPATSGIGFRRELGIPAEAPLIVKVSKLQVAKGHLCFIRAAALVARICPQARFIIVGSPVDGHEDEAMAIRRAAEEGISAGYLMLLDARAGLAEVYAAADVVVHCPVYPDPYPTVTLMAMAMSKAVVGTEIGGIPEQIEHGRSGLLVPAGDERRLADSIVDLIYDRAKRTGLGSGARNRALSLCDPGSQAPRLVTLYRNVLRTRGHRVPALLDVAHTPGRIAPEQEPPLQ